MEDTLIINCPNCNKKTIANNNECIYCKYILKEKEHNFDEEIYKFLYTKYNESKSKPDTIKVGMEKFGLSLKETKEIVDNISEQTYHKEVAENNSQPKEELPTNGMEYSKIQYNKNGVRKIPTLNILGIWC